MLWRPVCPGGNRPSSTENGEETVEVKDLAGNKTNAWFVGFAPFDNPEIAVVVLVENGGHGGYTAEVARDIFSEYFGMNSSDVTEDMTAKTTVESVR